MDALDPTDNVPFATLLYNNDVFLRSLYTGLTKNGMLVMQLGKVPSNLDPSESFSKNMSRLKVMEFLEDLGH